MTDVLARLGARVTGAAAILRPPADSLFEPVPAVLPGTAQSRIEEVAAEVIAPRPPAARPEVRRAAAPELFHLERSQPQPYDIARSPRIVEPPPGEQPRSADVVNVTVVQPRERIVETVHTIAPEPAATATRSSVTPEIDRAVLTLSGQPLDAVPFASAERPVPRAVTPPAVQRLEPAAQAPEVPRESRVPPAPDRTATLELLERLGKLRTASEPPSSQASSAPGVIRISIGRVEVRGTPPPMPQALPAPAASPRAGQSLADYLAGAARQTR